MSDVGIEGANTTESSGIGQQLSARSTSRSQSPNSICIDNKTREGIQDQIFGRLPRKKLPPWIPPHMHELKVEHAVKVG
ncbi:MAG: hypothetical protein EZS28_054380 [Streblomastix strix]|uniref:Uncharacterized protein n=1 Tax=Streblomastix strix TaxID=222440 RepID=A0A5J4QP25_9EUKA|nr:MAG: hypothetical protein EZS28_054380 [Streblomastix strix]